MQQHTNQRATCTRRLLCKPLALGGRTFWGRPAQPQGRTPESVRQLLDARWPTMSSSQDKTSRSARSSPGQQEMRHSLTAGSDFLQGREERFSSGSGKKQCKPQQPATLTAAIHHVTVTYPSGAGTRLLSQAKAQQLSVSQNTRADTQTGKQSTVVEIWHYLFWHQAQIVLENQWGITMINI